MKATILVGDVLTRIKEIPDQTVQCVVTSPPYWGLRDYGHDGQLGLEPTPEAYVENMVAVFREVQRILKDDGVLWLNLGDSYKPSGNGSTKKGLNERYFGKEFASNKQGADEGHLDRSKFKADNIKPKDLVGIPWRVAFALQADGWWLRQDIIWHKPNPMPESVTDRCTKAHEYVFMLTKSGRYYFDNQAIKEPLAEESIGRKKRQENLIERTGVGTLGKQIEQGVDPKHGYAGLALARNGKTGYAEDGLRNKRSVWNISTKPFRGAHFAVMPEALCEPPILATSRPDDTVFDPFTGSGTVAVVALRHGRNYLGIELNPGYTQIAANRITDSQPIFNEIELL
jgi:DNA modification methylase